MANEINLADFGQSRRFIGHGSVRQKFVRFRYRHIALRQAMRAPARMTNFKEQLS